MTSDFTTSFDSKAKPGTTPNVVIVRDGEDLIGARAFGGEAEVSSNSIVTYCETGDIFWLRCQSEGKIVWPIFYAFICLAVLILL